MGNLSQQTIRPASPVWLGRSWPGWTSTATAVSWNMRLWLLFRGGEDLKVLLLVDWNFDLRLWGDWDLDFDPLLLGLWEWDMFLEAGVASFPQAAPTSSFWLLVLCKKWREKPGRRVVCTTSGRHEGRQRRSSAWLGNFEVLLLILCSRTWDCNVRKTASL